MFLVYLAYSNSFLITNFKKYWNRQNYWCKKNINSNADFNEAIFKKRVPKSKTILWSSILFFIAFGTLIFSLRTQNHHTFLASLTNFLIAHWTVYNRNILPKQNRNIFKFTKQNSLTNFYHKSSRNIWNISLTTGCFILITLECLL